MIDIFTEMDFECLIFSINIMNICMLSNELFLSCCKIIIIFLQLIAKL